MNTSRSGFVPTLLRIYLLQDLFLSFGRPLKIVQKIILSFIGIFTIAIAKMSFSGTLTLLRTHSSQNKVDLASHGVHGYFLLDAPLSFPEHLLQPGEAIQQQEEVHEQEYTDKHWEQDGPHLLNQRRRGRVRLCLLLTGGGVLVLSRRLEVQLVLQDVEVVRRQLIGKILERVYQQIVV